MGVCFRKHIPIINWICLPCFCHYKRVPGDDQARQMNYRYISISDTTVRSRISEMSEDILEQVVTNVNASPYFALQLDELMGVVCCEQLLEYVRYMKGDSVEEDCRFSEPLTATTHGEDVFRTLENFFADKELEWAKLVGICTDGAPSMIGIRSGFKGFVKQVAPPRHNHPLHN